MRWNYLMLEMYCSYSEKEFKNVPCCKTNVGSIGAICLSDGENICTYCGFKEARSTVALSNGEGEVIQTKGFSDDNEINEEKWKMRQLEWCEKWIRRLKEDN